MEECVIDNLKGNMAKIYVNWYSIKIHVFVPCTHFVPASYES